MDDMSNNKERYGTVDDQSRDDLSKITDMVFISAGHKHKLR